MRKKEGEKQGRNPLRSTRLSYERYTQLDQTSENIDDCHDNHRARQGDVIERQLGDEAHESEEFDRYEKRRKFPNEKGEKHPPTLHN